MAQKLGNFLVREGLITPEQLDSALQEQKANGGMLGSNLVKMGYIEEAELMEFLSKQFGVPSTDPSKLDVDSDVIEMIPANIVQKYKIVPISLEGQTLTIAMVDPSNIFIIDDIKFLTRKNIRVTVATETSIKSAMDRFYDAGASLEDVMSEFDEEGVDVVEASDGRDVDRVAARKQNQAHCVSLAEEEGGQGGGQQSGVFGLGEIGGGVGHGARVVHGQHGP